MEISNSLKDISYKNTNQKYLCAIQKFLDKVSNIENVDLRNEIIYQMLECDKILTELFVSKDQK